MFDFLPFDWEGVSAVADVALVLINLLLLASLIMAVKNLKEARKSNTSQILFWAIEQMEEIKEDIVVLQGLKKSYTMWSDAELHSARRVSYRFQRLSYFARNGLIDKRHFKKMWGVQIVKMWALLKDWIVSLRVAAGEPVSAKTGAYLRADFELLANEYQDFVNRLTSATHRTSR